MNKKIISFLLAGASFFGNLHQITYANITKSMIMDATRGIENYIVQGQEVEGMFPKQSNLKEETLSERDIESSISKMFENTSEKTDMQYIIDALNLLDPYIYNLTGTTTNFRFYDGYKQEISITNILTWDYKKDKGEGSPNFMRCIFPSSAGTLSDMGGLDSFESFTKDCSPTPELIARITGYIHNYIRTPDESERKKAEEALNNAYRIANSKGKLLSENDTNNLIKFFEEYLEENKSQQNNKGKKYFKTVLYLLKNAEKMIKNQEEDGQNFEKILPKYIPEKMLMSYFIQHFSKSEDVKNFYKEAKRVVKLLSEVDSKKLKKSCERLKNLNKILEKVKIDEDSPYKEELHENAEAKIVQKSEGKGVKFSTKTFPDCADITVRHIMNLLIYDKDRKWGDVIKEGEEDYNEILNAMKNADQVIKSRTLKERLHLFFHYQANHVKGADAVDIESRSFWNYVISNMDVNSDTEKGMYKIKYCRCGNELSMGFLNMLKLIYNMAIALKGENDNSKIAKADIDNLEKIINKEVNGDLIQVLESAIKSTLGLINGNIKVSSLENLEVKSKDRDCFGTVKINNFIVNQSIRHAYVVFNPRSLDKFKESEGALKTFIEGDEVTQLLSKIFKLGLKRDVKISTFNNLFCLTKGIYDTGTQFYKNFKTLKFFKDIQREEENHERIGELINEYCGESNIDVTDKNGRNKVKIPFFLFKNYVQMEEQFEKLLPKQKLYEFLKKTLNNNVCFNKDKVSFYYAVNENVKGDNLGNVTVWPLSASTAEEIAIPSSLSIKRRGVFNVSGVGNFAFLNNRCLKKLKIEVKEGQHLIIGSESFMGSGVEEVEISGNMEKLTIKKGAFESSELQIFEIQGNVKELNIEDYAFVNTKLKEFKVPVSVKKLTIGRGAFEGLSIETFEIPENVKTEELNIGEWAFANTKLKEFKVPVSVKKLAIGQAAFYESKLKIFEISENIDIKELSIENYAFEYSKLEKFKVPKSVEKLNIGMSAFKGTLFKSIEISEEIDEHTPHERFEISKNIKELNIGENAFKKCESLVSVILPNNPDKLLIKIGNGAFAKISRVTSGVLE